MSIWIACFGVRSPDLLYLTTWTTFFKNKNDFFAQEEKLYEILSGSDGKQEVVIFLEEERAVKRLAKNRCVALSAELLELLKKVYGEAQIKVVDKKGNFSTEI